MSMIRYAIVRGSTMSAETVARYLPSNYKVIWTGKTNWHYYPVGGWKQTPVVVDDVVVIQGRDSSGFTLDSYVAPRLGSGLMRCDEIDLSHPIMKEIPA